MNKNTAILFDVDGTLWNSTQSITESWCICLAEKYGGLTRPSQEEITGIMGLTERQIADTLLLPYGERRYDAAKDCLRDEIAHLYVTKPVFYPGVQDTIRSLSETHKIAIVSNCDYGYIEALLALSGLSDCVCDWEHAGRTGLSKGENIRLVMERQHIRDAVYVGDMPSDRDAARRAGVGFIHAAYGFGAPMPEETEITSFDRLLSLFD